MIHPYTTNRLSLSPLVIDDAEFILELVNTPQWVQFIGQRNVGSKVDAVAYIQKILDSSTIKYWVVRLHDRTPIGVVTFLKKEYLPHHDLGFAFLPQYGKKGYAFEAAREVLADKLADPNHNQILATVKRDNVKSIELLEKLGFTFQRELVNGDNQLKVYVVSAGLIER